MNLFQSAPSLFDRERLLALYPLPLPAPVTSMAPVLAPPDSRGWFRVERKKYGETSSLSKRNLLGDADQALMRDMAPGASAVAAVGCAPRGPLRGYYAVSISGNWRITLRFEDGAAVDVDYVDYR